MGDHHNPRNQSSSGSQDFHTILGIAKGASIRDVCKAYKSLVMRWHPDKNPNKIEAEAKFKTINEAYEALKDKQQEDKKSNGVYECFSDNEGGSRPTTPKTPFRHRSVDSYSASSPTFLPKSASRRSNTPTRATPSLGSLPKSTSQRSASPGSLPKSTSQRSTPSPGSLPKSTSQRSTPSPGSLPKSTSQRSASPGSLPKSTSQRSTNPIMFSYSTARRKLPPVEKTLECTLDELCHGCVKKIKVTRDVLTDTGIIVQEEELLRIKVKPGWKKGTKITFEGMGDEKPGTYPADIIFCIDEKRHPLFKREGDDLVLAIEIPLVKALTGCSFSIPLLGGEKMSLSFDDIIYPGYEKIIRGQGMPIAKDQVGKRGDLRIKFRIIFPKQLNDEQRSDILSLLNDS